MLLLLLLTRSKPAMMSGKSLCSSMAFSTTPFITDASTPLKKNKVFMHPEEMET